MIYIVLTVILVFICYQFINITMTQLATASDKSKQTGLQGSFFNPICKSTYQSLPKIYGNANYNRKKLENSKRRYIQRLSPTKHSCEFNLSNQSKKQNKKRQKIDEFYLSKRLSQPKITKCNKKDCFCNPNQQKKTQSFSFQSNLPQLSEMQELPDDMQTQHKVFARHSLDIMSPSGLDTLINYNKKTTNIKINTLKHQYKFANVNMQNTSTNSNNKKIANQTQFQYLSSDQAAFNQKIKTEQRVGIIKNLKMKNNDRKRKRYLAQESQQNESFQNRRLIKRKNEVKYHQQIKRSSSRSSNSKSISSIVFQGNLKEHTMFYENQKIIQDRKKAKNKRNQMNSNNLFIIPEQQQYSSFLKNYQPLNPEFKLKKLLQMPNFYILHEDESVYFGEVKDNIKEGLGIQIREKSIFEGVWEKNKKIKGCQKNIDGVYQGQFMNGKRYGYGVFRWNNGQIFKGEWRDGTKNGYGVWKSPKGDTYQGQWLKNRQNGKGTFKHKDNLYIGEFKDFLKHGKGQQKFQNGDYYIGEYNNGKPHGKGRYKWKDGKEYIGQFLNGVRKGKGVLKQLNGSTYSGNFDEDCKNGYGVQTYTTGQRFEGQFVQGLKKNGKIYGKNGTIIFID